MMVPHLHLQTPCLLIQDMLIPKTPTTSQGCQANFRNDESKIICLFCNLCVIVSNLVYNIYTSNYLVNYIHIIFF
jgi:hypothetical protein